MTLFEAKVEFIVKPLLASAFTAVTFVDGVEISVKIVSGLAAIGVLIIQWLTYKMNKQKLDENKNKDEKQK